MNIMKKSFPFIVMMLLAVAVLCSCERGKSDPKDARDAFLGDYTYTYVVPDSIPIYMGSTLMDYFPLEGEGEFSLIEGDTVNELWMIDSGDTALAIVTGNKIYLEPVTLTETFNGIEIETRYNYGYGVLSGNRITWTVDVFMSATYTGLTMSGSGLMDLVATKKE